MSAGIATVTGMPAAAPYAASAAAAFPAEGAARARAPRARAIDTATLIPRALNEPVGLRASSLIQTCSPTGRSGVNPSTRVTAATGAIGRTPRRTAESECATRLSNMVGNVAPRWSVYSASSGRSHATQVACRRSGACSLPHAAQRRLLSRGLSGVSRTRAGRRYRSASDRPTGTGAWAGRRGPRRLASARAKASEPAQASCALASAASASVSVRPGFSRTSRRA